MLFFAAASTPAGPLAEALAREGDAVAARREALRDALRADAPPPSGETLAADGGAAWTAVLATLTRLPARAVVLFYRSQVAPAIGSRCSMVPSCSEYFRIASEKHGWLGIPMQGDRFVREPGLVQRRVNPVREGTLEKYADPVEAHDRWHAH